jgi:hypothetical protein
MSGSRSSRSVPPDHVAVIQRHAHERTQEVGLALAVREFPGSTVHAVAAGDFPTTLRRCFELAVELDREWTVTVDGDVLLLPGSGRSILDLGRRLPPRVAHAWFLVQDLVTGEARSAGVRLYRTSTMAAALQRGDWGGRTRPETELLRSLPDIEHRDPSVLVGLHDHEQFYRDLVRTAFVMIRKKPAQRERLLALWKTHSKDPDFAALVAGGEAAWEDDRPISFEASDYREIASTFLLRSGLREKGPLSRIPDPEQLEALVPRSAQRLRRPGLPARYTPRVWRKLGNGVRGLPLARYAAERTMATVLRR